MRAAAVQINLSGIKEQNLEKSLMYIKKASDCDLVVLPEMVMGNRGDGVELYQLAEDVETGSFASSLRNAAVRYQVDVCACLWEETGTEKVYNTAVVYGSDGSIKAKYRKLHLFDALSFTESDYMLRGSERPPVFESGGIKCGLSICYDLRFPETYRSLVKRGAELFIVPAAWYGGELKIEHLHTLLRTRALENTCYALTANLCGGNFSGYSVSFGPFAEECSALQNDEGLLVIEVDKKHLSEVRSKLPCLENFRNDIFL
ncbi:Nitrilase/cyanide hydratase and apolipoprotein N- acyltransferase [Denitrovibrio acetiphilus DSM 12809]|uniref:Nitrilase/cyanide hydratase and apolipoprotein N-acyltransferase n=1 Tax=Denitrovibrio acetiphilus (strain DSM 12809 / NBRC 114555 / N2460) TaxID=522772 RepID=D4H6R0_DENA2|nr:carbon-nitrogen hydrolase family protein [Denitrovibrio acetiphilus]ADD67776.1 Nitrilase/cyanide hydratase and apolipoprotein N- acyltransferase [Denitrovibrio acetiphilus DSM 12809]